MTLWQVGGVRNVLEKMRVKDCDFHVFGAEQHRYLLGPTLTEEELTAFEQEHHVTLPYDYRFFLQCIGDGGAGPSYGIPSLKNAMRDSDLSGPFPLIGAEEEIPIEISPVRKNTNIFPGMLLIGYEGCGTCLYLVVNGPAYGTIWGVRDEFYPSEMSFETWYSGWLTYLEDRYL
jgi:hypothetical protein